MNKNNNFITAFCTLSNEALNDPVVVGRLQWSKFRKSTKNPNLYIKSISKYRVEDSSNNVSFYYYQEGKRKQVDNKTFSALVKDIDNKHEKTLRTRAFNAANGYDSSYFKSLEAHYARI